MANYASGGRSCAFVLQLLVASSWVAGCSSSDSSGGLDCRARSDREDPRDGCYCETLAANEEPSTTFPKVAQCNDTYAGANTTICCKNEDSCLCFYVGCEQDSLTHTCKCGPDNGAAILSSQTEVGTCTPPSSGGRCCTNTSTGQCSCDAYGPGCSAQYGETEVASCSAHTSVAGCSKGEKVSSCQ